MFLIFCFVIHSGCAIFHQKKGHFTTNQGISLHYVEKGEGQPVILIHGILANADINWRFPGIINRLSKNFYVIAFDLRGHGKSDKPQGKEMYGIQLVNDVCKIMDHLNIEKAHVVGYSLGGFIALKLVTCYPERIYSVTIAGAGWEKSTPENLDRLEKIYTAMRNNNDCTPLFELVGMRKRGVERISVAIGNWYFRRTNDLDIIADLLESTPDLEVKEEDLKNCNVPILLIGGTADPMCKTIPELNDALPNSQVVWINKGTHLTTLFKKEFVKSIENFLINNKQP
ncbi:MAG: alpha/beta fold hydrolase [Candidatus Hydrogenedens sp.]